MVLGAFGRIVGGLLFSAAVLGGCKERAAAPTARAAPHARELAGPPVTGPGTWYRARLVFDGIGELPFFLHVPPVGQDGPAHVLNGDETVELRAEWRESELSITGPWTYTSLIEAQLDPATGALAGSWTRDTPLWGEVVRRFVATPIAAPDPRTRFPGAGHPGPAGVAGTWRFRFATHQEGKGAFEQDPDGVVRGYIKPGQLGDIRYLAGNLRGGKLSLSTFNGNSANLVLAELSPDGASMSGVMSMQNKWNERFTATRAEADYPFVNKVHLQPGKQTVSLRGLDRYRGKPTLAILFATWCPSCNDAVPYFKGLYAKYHRQGLEILGVAYDLSDDERATQAKLAQFRAQHGIPWELLQVPCTMETWARAMPPELVGWDGLPIILLVRPDGTVQTVFGGWFGPATGAEGEHLRAWFEASTRELLGAH